MRYQAVILRSAVVMALSGCYTDKMVLTNDQGQTQTCEFTGHVGIVSPIVTHEKYKKCVGQAKASGYKEGLPIKQGS